MRKPLKTLYVSRYSNPPVYFKFVDGVSNKYDNELTLYQVITIYKTLQKSKTYFFKMDGVWTNGKFYLIEPINPTHTYNNLIEELKDNDIIC